MFLLYPKQRIRHYEPVNSFYGTSVSLPISVDKIGMACRLTVNVGYAYNGDLEQILESVSLPLLHQIPIPLSNEQKASFCMLQPHQFAVV